MSKRKPILKTITEIMVNHPIKSTVVSTSTEEFPHTVFMPCVHDPFEGVWWGISKSGHKSSNRKMTTRKDDTRKWVFVADIGGIRTRGYEDFISVKEDDITMAAEALRDF